MPEFMATPAIEAMLEEIVSKLDEMSSQLRICAGPPTPSPASIPTHVAGIDEDLERGVGDSAATSTSSPTLDDREHALSTLTAIVGSNNQAREFEIPTSCKLVMPSSVPPASSTSSAPSQDAYPGFQSGVDRLSHLPDTLLCDIISRLPIKDAVRTAVLSRRWIAAPFHAGLADLRLNSNHFCGLVPRLLEQINLQQQDCVRLLLADDDLSGCISALASPTTSPTSTPNQVATSALQFGTTELLYASPTRCSTLGLYDIICVLSSVTKSLGSPLVYLASIPLHIAVSDESSDASKVFEIMFHHIAVSDMAVKGIYEYAKVKSVSLCACFFADTIDIIDEFVVCDDLQSNDELHSHLLDMFMASSTPPSTTNVRFQQVSKMSKPPWFQFIDLARAWSEKTLLADGFLLESSPWHTLNLGFNPSNSPHNLLWFQFLQSAAQVQEGNKKEIALFLSTVSQVWLFTDVLTAENYIVISRLHKPSALGALMIGTSSPQTIYRLLSRASWEFKPCPPPGQRLCMHLVSSYTSQLKENSTQLVLLEASLTHGHCNLLKYVIVLMVLASQMVSTSIKSGWLTAQVHLCLFQNMCAYQLLMLVWQPSMPPLVQLKKASRGTSLQLLPVHSNFQSYISREHPLLLELVDTKEDVQAASLLMPLWPSPTIPEPWPACVSDMLSGSEQATQLFMLAWLLSSYKAHVELIFVASIKESLNWVWPLLLNFASIPIAAAPHLYMQHTVCLLSALGLRGTSLLMVSMVMFPQSTTGCYAFHYFNIRAVLFVGMDNLCFCTIVYVTHEMLLMGKPWIMTELAWNCWDLMCSVLQPTLYLIASNIVALEIPWDPGAGELLGAVRPDTITYPTVPLSTHIALLKEAIKVSRDLISTTAWGQAVFYGGGNVTVQPGDIREEPKS